MGIIIGNGVIFQKNFRTLAEVTFFLRCSKCPEITQFRLNELTVERKKSKVKALLSGAAIGKTQFIGTRITCNAAENLDEKFFYLSGVAINVETLKKIIEGRV